MNKFLASLAAAGQINIAADFSEKGSLSGGQSLSIKGGRGKRVTCNSGLLWVTQEGDLEDYLLGASESMVLSGKGKVLLSALGTATYRVA